MSRTRAESELRATLECSSAAACERETNNFYGRMPEELHPRLHPILQSMNFRSLVRGEKTSSSPPSIFLSRSAGDNATLIDR